MPMYSDILKELRRDKKLRQEQIAAHFQMSQVSYSRYEIGERKMPVQMLCELANLLETNTDYILGLTIVESPSPLSSPKNVDSVYPPILKSVRKKNGYTQEQMGARFGISGATYGRYENGRQKMDVNMLSILSELFDTSTDYLLGRTSDPTPYPRRMTHA